MQRPRARPRRPQGAPRSTAARCRQGGRAAAGRSAACSGATGGSAPRRAQVLLLAWKMGAQRMGYFARGEFECGARLLRAADAKALRRAALALEDEVAAPAALLAFATFAFRYCLTVRARRRRVPAPRGHAVGHAAQAPRLPCWLSRGRARCWPRQRRGAARRRARGRAARRPALTRPARAPAGAAAEGGGPRDGRADAAHRPAAHRAAPGRAPALPAGLQGRRSPFACFRML